MDVIAVFSAILYLLVLARLWDAAASHRRALDRERVLRQVGLALVATADVPQVAAAVQDAVDALLGGHSQGDALLGVQIDGTLLAVNNDFEAGAGPAARAAGRDVALAGEGDGAGPHADAAAAQGADGAPRARTRCCCAR